MTIEMLKTWNEFVAGQKPVQFLQSWQWGEFQKKLGRQIFYLKGDWGQALIIKYNLPFNKNYLYCPRGPILVQTDVDWARTDADNSKRRLTQTEARMNANTDTDSSRYLTGIDAKKFFEEIKNLVAKEKSIFLRIEPPVLSSIQYPVSSIQRVADVQPSETIILDLSKSEEELLAKMHYKTRYNIRLAKRHGVKIREGSLIEIGAFLKLLHQTTKRDKFRPYSDNYYRQLLSINQNFVKLFFAEYNNKILAANIIIFFGDTVTYVHGASADEYRNLMAPHLLHWEIICRAKTLNYHFYDFWGIDENKWPGITRFKKGFGGQIIKYPGTYDLIFDKFWYRLYRLGKMFRNW